MTVVVLVFIFCFVTAKSCSESLDIHPEPRVHFGARPAFISISHAVHGGSMDIRAAFSLLNLFSLLDTALFSECSCVRCFFPFMSVSVFVFFNISKRFRFHLPLALPQVFNFSVLCLAMNAFICFGVWFLFFLMLVLSAVLLYS